MDDQDEDFGYSSLPPKGWIRLLVIEPASRPAEPLEARLETHDIASNPEYEALSYTWGHEPADSLLNIDGRRLLIRRNLLGALTALRRPDGPLSLWVDAICINQHDLTERNHQVWQMKDIYSRAQLVHVWLGDADTIADSDFGMDFIHNFGEALMRRHPRRRIRVGSTWNADTEVGTGFVSNSTLSENEFFEYYGYLTLHLGARGGEHAGLRGAVHLLRRPWWKRMWTLQESVLGRHVTVHCGAKRVQMPYFFEFSYFLFLAMAYHPRFSFESLPGDVALRAVFRIADLHDHIGGRGHVPTLLAVDSSWNRAASDDKDRIMALLGLVSWRSSLRPEYDWDIGRVYQAAINNIVMEEGNLGFLGLISEERVLRRPDLPSWIPDLRLHTQHRSDYLTSLSKAVFHVFVYNASLAEHGNQWAEMHTEENGSLLVVRGILLDRIFTIGAKAPDHREHQAEDMSGIGSTVSFEEAWWTELVRRWATLVFTTKLMGKLATLVFTMELGERERRLEALVQAGFPSVEHPAALINMLDTFLEPGVFPVPLGRDIPSSSTTTTASPTKHAMALRILLDLDEYAPTGEDYLTAFARCLLVDLKQGPHRDYDPGKPQRLDPQDDVVSLLTEQDDCRTSDNYTTSSPNRLFAWWASFSGPRATHLRLIEQFNRVFFITQGGGYMGLGPPWLREHDAVCILSGGAVAYALRELDGDRWSYLGEW